MQPWLDFFRLCAADDRSLPEQGGRKPWRLNQNYAADVMLLRYGKLTILNWASADNRHPDFAAAKSGPGVELRAIVFDHLHWARFGSAA